VAKRSPRWDAGGLARHVAHFTMVRWMDEAEAKEARAAADLVQRLMDASEALLKVGDHPGSAVDEELRAALTEAKQWKARLRQRLNEPDPV
jgi:hypothetical protein